MWANPQEPEDLVLFTEGILNEKLHFLCSVASIVFISYGGWNVWDDIFRIKKVVKGL